jgi:hypothetical protein
MTRLSPAALGLALLSLPATGQTFDYPDFTSTAGLNLVGLAAQSGAVMRLQDNAAPAVNSDNRGAAWYAAPVEVAGGFETTFVFNMNSPSTTGGSDGMAFVIQNDLVAGSAPIVNGGPDGTGATAIGRHAAAAGFGLFASSPVGDSVDNSIAIHLDTYLNGNPWGDLDSNHISVHTGGIGDNTQDEAASLGRTTGLPTNLNDGQNHTLRVVYVPGSLEIELDGALVLAVPYAFETGGVYQDSGTPVGGLQLIGGTRAYVGFTSGAGSARENRDVVSWAFTSTSQNSGTAYCFGDGTGSACPCAGFGGPGEGCITTSGSGATLVGTGDAAVVSDTLLLSVSGGPANKPGIFFQGNNQLGGGNGNPAGDGLLCTAGGTIRYSVNPLDATGATSQTGFGVNAGAGLTRNYQYWFRDTGNACGGQFNFTNGWTVTWQ